jgi:hypothetical protein
VIVAGAGGAYGATNVLVAPLMIIVPEAARLTVVPAYITAGASGAKTTPGASVKTPVPPAVNVSLPRVKTARGDVVGAANVLVSPLIMIVPEAARLSVVPAYVIAGASGAKTTSGASVKTPVPTAVNVSVPRVKTAGGVVVGADAGTGASGIVLGAPYTMTPPLEANETGVLFMIVV